MSRLRELGVRNVRDGLCPTCEYQIDRLKRLGHGRHPVEPRHRHARGRNRVDRRAGLKVIREPPARTRSSRSRRPTSRTSPATRTGSRRRDVPARALHARQGRPGAGAAAGRSARPSSTATSRSQLGDLSALPRPRQHAPLPRRRPAAAQPRRREASSPRRVGPQADGRDGGRLPHRPGAHRRAPTAPPSGRVATYMPRTGLEGFVGGIERTYIYQLVDPWSPAEAKRRGSRRRRTRSACCAPTCRRKPAFLRAAQPARAPSTATPRRSPNPGGLRLALEGAGPDVRQPAAALGGRHVLPGAVAHRERLGPRSPTGPVAGARSGRRRARRPDRLAPALRPGRPPTRRRAALDRPERGSRSTWPAHRSCCG